MSNLKVKPLEWYMKDKVHEELVEEFDEVPWTFKLVGRDGYYCEQDNVWFEVNGRGYYVFKDRSRARQHFCYEFSVNDEAILTNREAEAMQEVLKTTRDPQVKKALRSRLRLHQDALSVRMSTREIHRRMLRYKK